jgi:hypothetical protein
MTIRKIKLAWKYRRLLWKYRRVIAHRRQIAAGAVAAAALGVGVYMNRRRSTEAPRAANG